MFRLPRAPDFPAPPGSVYWVAGVACLALAGHLTRLPPWLVLFTLALIGWRCLAPSSLRRRIGRVVRTALALLLFVGVVAEFGRVFGRDAGVALLAGLSGLKFVELDDKRRDYAVSVLLSFLVALGAVLYQQTTLAALHAGATLALGLAALNRLADPGPAATGPILVRAGRLLALAVPIALMLYLFFPRLEGSLWGLPGGQSIARSGMTNQLDPGSVSELSRNDAAAFRAVFDGPRPPMAARYWRGLVLEASDGRRWLESRTPAPTGAPPASGAQPVTYTVTLEPSGQRWLFALDLPVRGDGATRPGPGYTLRSPRPIDEVTRYQATSFLQFRTPGITREEWLRNLGLPPVSPRVAGLAQRLREQGGGDARSIAAAALAYFREQPFRYTLQPPLLGADPVDEFLFEQRAGYCEHYASAFTTLMRAAGVPARVVVGYLGGEPDPDGAYMLVRQSDAHAWSEIWTADAGWQRVDPTAAVAPERVEYGAETVRQLVARGAQLGTLQAAELARIVRRDWLEGGWRRAAWFIDGLDRAWNDWVAAYGPQQQLDLLRSLGLRATGVRDLVVVLTAGLTFLLALVGTVAWLGRERTPPVSAAYQRYCRRLARAGIERAPHEGPLAYLERCAASRPELREQMARITDLYITLRYRERGGDALVRELRTQVNRFRPAA